MENCSQLCVLKSKFLTVSKILRRFNETDNIRDRQRTERPKNVTNDENSYNIMLGVTENPKTLVQQLALNHNMCRSSVQKILKREKYHPSKIHLPQELSKDELHRRIEFCEIMGDGLNQDGKFINQLLLSDTPAPLFQFMYLQFYHFYNDWKLV